MANILRIEENERIDKTDFDFLSESAILSDQEFVANFLVDPLRSISGAAQRAFILEGFLPSQASSTQVTVTTGKAVLAYRDSGVVKYGAFTVGGDVAKTLTVTGASSTYYVWLRFDYLDGELGSRIFWNPTGDGTEFANTINTRQIPSWSIRIEDYTQGSPGAEWTKIGEVVWTGTAITSVTDTRHLFFEGVAGSSYQPNWSSDGGGLSTDRNADRSTYGVKSLQTFTAAVRQCLEDIKGRGLRKWYARDIGGMNIGFDAAPVEDTLAVGDAAFYMSLNSSTHVAKLEFMANYSIGMDRDFPAIILTANSVAGLIVADTTAGFNGDLTVGGALTINGSSLDIQGTDPVISLDTDDTITYLSSTNVMQFKIGATAIASLSKGSSVTKLTMPAGYTLSLLDNTTEMAALSGNSGVPKLTLGTDFSFYIATSNATKNGFLAFEGSGNTLEYTSSTHSLACYTNSSLIWTTSSVGLIPGGSGTKDLGSIINLWGNILGSKFSTPTSDPGNSGSGFVAYTGVTNVSANGTGPGSILMKGSTGRQTVGFLKFYSGTDSYWIPFFDTITS